MIKCQNCKTEFKIVDEDRAFYKKMDVPEPTFCPDCRMQRRFAFRNERALYKRKCDLCKKDVIGVYRENTSFPVYCSDCWHSDKWDVSQFYLGVDFSRPFFEQLKELQIKVPRPHSNNARNFRFINSTYTNCAGDLKDCYLIFGALTDENCAYSHYINNSKDCYDTLYCLKSEKCYECFDVEKCYDLSFSQSCVECRDSMFLFDCRNCSNCIGCVGLRSKSYHIFNKPYTKEDYLKEREKIDLNSHSGISDFREKYLKEVYYKFPRKYYHGQMNKDFSGDYVSSSEKTYDAFYTKNARNVKFSFWNLNAKDVYDYFSWGDTEFSYECVACGDGTYGCKFIDTSWSNIRNLEYTSLCYSSSDLFGCIGLRKKQYHILNKQYTKEEYEELVPKIKKHMNDMPYTDRKGNVYKYGEYRPMETSPFPYNDTVAQEHFPLSKQEALEMGYPYQDMEEKEHNVTLKIGQVPDSIKDVDDSILKQVIECEHQGKCDDQCTKAFRIIPLELKFYKDMNLPLPILCPNCRHAQRVKQRNPLKLWHRKCMKKGCNTEFETAYAPDRKEIVYCEKCYNKEVV